MGFSCVDGSDEKEQEVLLLNDENRLETTTTRQSSGGMDLHSFEFGGVDQFWPVEHPSEPQDEDRPVTCPIPTTSSLVVLPKESRMQEPRRLSTGSLTRRAQVNRYKEGIEVAIEEAPVRAVRKRHHHHTLPRDHHTTVNPLALIRMSRPPPPPPLLPTQNLTIFQMLQQVDQFQP